MKTLDILTPLQESVSTQDLISKLGQEATISYSSDVKLTGGKKNPQLGKVKKLTNNLQVLLIGNGGEYAAARKAEAGGEDFEVQPRKWGTRNADGLINHNGVLYVEFIVKGRGEKSQYFLDGQPIDKSEIQGLPAETTPSDQASGVVLRAIKIENIISLK